MASGMSTDLNMNLVPDECEAPADPNCDGATDFGDIDPFVMYLSNFTTWQATYNGCNPLNGDINGDGTYPSFGDVNAFVALLTNG
jgi:hypothetical protein